MIVGTENIPFDYEHQMGLRLLHVQEEHCMCDHIPFNLTGN